MKFLYRNLTPRQLVALGLIVPCLTLLVIGWLNWQSVRDQLKTRELVRQTRSVLIALGVFRYSLSDAESCQFRYILSHNVENLDYYHQLVKDTNDQIKFIRENTSANPLQQKFLNGIDGPLAAKLQEMDHCLALEQSGDHSGALQEAGASQSGKNMFIIEKAVENMQIVQTQGLLVWQNIYQHDFKLNVLLSLLTITLSMAFIGGVILLLRRMAQLQSMVTLSALTDMIEYENGLIPVEEYLKRRHHALVTYGQAQIEAERILAQLERRKYRPKSAQPA